MGKRTKTFFEESLMQNNNSYYYYLRRLTDLAITMFDWQNVPDSIDIRYLELTLFNQGQAVFFRDEVMGFLALKFALAGPLDVYRIPVKRRAYSVNGYQKNLDNTDSVIIWNNYLHTNSYVNIVDFARRLYNLDRIIDVNANAQKTPVVVVCDEKQRLTFLNLYKEMDGNAPVIFGDKNIDLNNVKSLRTEAPFVADKLYTLKTEIWNEALTTLGISNVNIQKRERLIKDEVQRNLGGTIASRFSRLSSRQEACEKINKMFGLDMWVEYRDEQLEEIAKDMVLTNESEESEGDVNE